MSYFFYPIRNEGINGHIGVNESGASMPLLADYFRVKILLIKIFIEIDFNSIIEIWFYGS
ncbi:hypothetical protein C9446_00630 [Providencia heimbachae]|nr:hypothetical protein C9446_00630 [Providencia heimbachae]